MRFVTRRRPPLASLAVILVTTATWLLAAGGPVAGVPGDRHPPAGQDVEPMLRGPVTGGRGVPTLATTSFDLATVGYTSEEYFLSGSASAYSSSSPLTPDGEWTTQPAGTAPYTTRIVVNRPLDAKKFSGTVIVEWLNTTGGSDLAPSWDGAHNEMIRDGFAWVGVSAQSVGVQALIAADAERYGSLNHPGDTYSYDIFSQAGQAVRQRPEPDPITGLKAKRVIAMGFSQSAYRLVTYVNAVHPLTHVYDAYLMQNRGPTGTNLSESPQTIIAAPDTTIVRSDLDVPVLTLVTETDLIGLGYYPARQRDTKRFRLWEVAGTAHADFYVAVLAADDTGDGTAEVALLDAARRPTYCDQLSNAGPQYAVAQAAVYHLDQWVRGGTPPPRAPRLAVTADPTPLIKRDRHGNALGGVRTPLVDVPTATLRGDGNSGPGFCASLFGTTVPFDDATLTSLYPSHASYVAKFDKATDEAVQRGFLLPPEAKNLKAAAAASSIGTGN